MFFQCCLFGRGACTGSARELGQAGIPRGSGPAAAEAQRRLQSWGSQRDLLETGTALSLPSLDRFSASSQGWVSYTPIEAQTLQLSDSEELDVVSVNVRDKEDSPPQSRAYEELVQVVTRAVDWPAEKEDVRSRKKKRSTKKGRTHLAFSCTNSMPGTAVFSWSPHRSWEKPVLYSLYSTQTSHYSSIINTYI